MPPTGPSGEDEFLLPEYQNLSQAIQCQRNSVTLIACPSCDEVLTHWREGQKVLRARQRFMANEAAIVIEGQNGVVPIA
jgi:hypothetical protein